MKKNRTILILPILIICLLLSCSGEGPKSTVEKMRDAACNADVELFFSNIDKEYIDNEYINETYGNSDNELSKEYGFVTVMLVKAFMKYGKYFGYDFGESILDWAWEYIEEDVAKGENSDYCKLEIIGPGKRFNSVIVSMPDGKPSEWTFKRSWGKYQLIDFGGEESDQTNATEDYSDFDVEELIDKAAEAKQEVEDEVSRISDYDNNYDFRKTRWGMSVDEVKESEKDGLFQEGKLEDESYTYLADHNCKFQEIEGYCFYRFYNSMLTIAAFFSEEEFSDPDIYIVTYEKFKKELISRYGDPYKEEIDWSDNTYKNEPDKHGEALLSGHVQYYTYWSTTDSDIMLNSLRNKSKVELVITYSYKDIDEKEK